MENSFSKQKGSTVFYGICGEGLGHYSRATVLIGELLAAGYRVEIFSSRRVGKLCREKFNNCQVHEVSGMQMHYENNTMHLPRTTWNNMKSIFHGPGAFSLIMKRARQCRLAGVISDYEPLTSITGNVLRVPVIAFDHQQVTTECRLEKNLVSSFSMGLLHFSNSTTYPWPSARVITSFFHPPWRKKRSGRERLLVGPILRPEVLTQEVECGDHVLVYQTSATMSSLQTVLDSLPGEKRVYGASSGITGHTLCSFNETDFIRDLATCRFAVVNGGYSTLSEALYFGKPVICFPVKNQAEQEINGHYIRHAGFGECYQIDDENDLPDFSAFLAKIERYREHIADNAIPCGNKKLVEYVLNRLDIWNQ